jgi:protein TonB
MIRQNVSVNRTGSRCDQHGDIIMIRRLLLLLAALLLASCSHAPIGAPGGRVDTTADGTSTARTLDAYKADLAQRITAVNSTRVHADRPQALLRSVVVVSYAVDRDGNLVRSQVLRSNHDRSNEQTALATLRSSAPFPKPAPQLLRNGRVELAESWLFNDDGRFQLRSIAQEQMEE